MIVLYTGITTPTIHQFTEELAGMNDWYSLGVALLVPVSKLKEITTSSPKEGTAWWSDIITALEKTGHCLLD